MSIIYAGGISVVVLAVLGILAATERLSMNCASAIIDVSQAGFLRVGAEFNWCVATTEITARPLAPSKQPELRAALAGLHKKDIVGTFALVGGSPAVLFPYSLYAPGAWLEDNRRSE